MTNYDTVRDELSSRGYGEDSAVSKAVLELLYILDSQELPDKGTKRLVVDQFHSLVANPNLLISSMEKEEGVWGQFYLGSAPIGSIVRVKKYAYTSQPGSRFNGLVGRLVSGRAGRAVVRFIGHQDGIGHYLDPKYLEILKSTKD